MTARPASTRPTKRIEFRAHTLWGFYMSTAGWVSLAVVLGLGVDYIFRSQPTSGELFAQILLALFAPAFIVGSTVVHEYIHAITAKHLLDGEDVCIHFKNMGGLTTATVNEHRKLWRKLVVSLSPAILVSFAATAGVVGLTLSGALMTTGVVGAMLETVMVCLVMVAFVNLANLLPFKKFDGGAAVTDTVGHFKKWRQRKTVAV